VTQCQSQIIFLFTHVSNVSNVSHVSHVSHVRYFGGCVAYSECEMIFYFRTIRMYFSSLSLLTSDNWSREVTEYMSTLNVSLGISDTSVYLFLEEYFVCVMNRLLRHILYNVLRVIVYLCLTFY